jgi:hypothetical protein
MPTADPAIRRSKQQAYAASDKGRATEARRRLQRTQSGFNRTHMQEYRAAQAEYLEQVFHPSPDKRIPVTGIRRLVVLQDLQIPFEDPKAVSEALSVVHRVNPDAVVLDGDIVDCYQESSFLKDFRLAADVTDEQHRRVRAFMALLKDIRVKIWMGGNHEERWWRAIKTMRERETNSPVVSNLLAYIKHTGKEVRIQDPIGSFSRVFGAADHGFTYYPWSHRLRAAARGVGERVPLPARARVRRRAELAAGHVRGGDRRAVLPGDPGADRPQGGEQRPGGAVLMKREGRPVDETDRWGITPPSTQW